MEILKIQRVGLSIWYRSKQLIEHSENKTALGPNYRALLCDPPLFARTEVVI